MRQGFNIGDIVIYNSKEGIIRGFNQANRTLAIVQFGEENKVLNVTTLRRK